jgi:hypothetical protein
MNPVLAFLLLMHLLIEHFFVVIMNAAVLHFWSWFCHVKNSSNKTTNTTTSCFSNFHANSKTSSSGLFSWSSWVAAVAKFFFLKQPCARQVLIACFHTFFFVWYLSLITWWKVGQKLQYVVNLLPRWSSCQRRSTYYNIWSSLVAFISSCLILSILVWNLYWVSAWLV